MFEPSSEIAVEAPPIALIGASPTIIIPDQEPGTFDNSVKTIGWSAVPIKLIVPPFSTINPLSIELFCQL